MLGYVALGILAGPDALGLLSDNILSAELAELGIMAMMFTIGLKFSLPKLIASRRNVFGLGASQVLICLTIVTAVLVAAGLRWDHALLCASIFAMSSTAVGLRLLHESGDVNTPLGTRVIAMLLFQDIAVIPLLIFFSSSTSEIGLSMLYTILKIVAVLFVVLQLGPRIMPPMLDLVSRQRSPELFTFFVMALVLSLSLLTQMSGLSLVLGSFLAGMLLAESMHRYKVEELINPFRELFLGFFFVSIGLLFRPHLIFENFAFILSGTVLVLLLKPLLIYLLARLFQTYHWNSVRTALLLGGCGEFGFVLLTAASKGGMPESLLQTLFAINMLAMLAIPLLIPISNKMRSTLGGNSDWMISARDTTRIAAQSAKMRDHLIICGYGRTGQVISRLLGNRGISWVAAENSHELFASAFSAGENVTFGDARNREVLIGLGVSSAKALITTYDNHPTMVRTVQQARELNPGLMILAKVYKATDLVEARTAGANFVTLTSLESALSMSALAMKSFGIGIRQIEDDVEKEHTEAQASTCFYSDSRPVDAAAAGGDRRRVSLTLDENASTIGLTVGATRAMLDEQDAAVLNVMRGNQNITDLNDEQLCINDVIVITGETTALEIAEKTILTGDPASTAQAAA